MALLEACEHGSTDSVVFVGDLVAKGPDSHGVVEWARTHGARAVLGNHDVHVLRWRWAARDGKPPPSLGADHRVVVDDLVEDDWRYLESRPYFIRLTEHGVVVVHGGLVPGVALEDQEPAHMVSMRTLRADGTPSKRLDDGELWGAQWPGPEEVVFGHDAITGLQEHPFATGLDTGCVYGRKLTAYVLPERRKVSVDAARNYTA